MPKDFYVHKLHTPRGLFQPKGVVNQRALQAHLDNMARQGWHLVYRTQDVTNQGTTVHTVWERDR